jgi:hypothetical protein
MSSGALGGVLECGMPSSLLTVHPVPAAIIIYSRKNEKFSADRSMLVCPSLVLDVRVLQLGNR